MTLKDRCLLVVCWLLDSVVFFALLGTTGVFVASFAPAPLGLVLLAAVVGAAVVLLAQGPGRAVQVRRDGQQVVVHNLFREMTIEREDVERVAEGFWASAVHRGGDVGYLVLKRKVRTFLLWRHRVPVHATFRWGNEGRQERAKAELRRVVEGSGASVRRGAG